MTLRCWLTGSACWNHYVTRQKCRLRGYSLYSYLYCQHRHPQGFRVKHVQFVNLVRKLLLGYSRQERQSGGSASYPRPYRHGPPFAVLFYRSEDGWRGGAHTAFVADFLTDTATYSLL